MGRRGRRSGPYRVADDEADEPGVVSVRSKALDAELTRLTNDGRVRAAALVGKTFHLDPVALLEETDPLKVNVRIAAHNYLQNEAEKARRKNKGKS